VAEYTRAGWPPDICHDMTLCTRSLAGEFVVPADLGACCAHFGVELTDTHAALADAEATAALLSAYILASGERRTGAELPAFGEMMRWPAPPRLATPQMWRGFADQLTAPGNDLMDGVEGLEWADECPELLDRKISGPERRPLDAMAASLGMVDAVCAEGLVVRDPDGEGRGADPND